MQFRVLGPIEVIDDGRRLPVASGRQIALLSFLVIHANRVVSAERIIDALWGDEPPESGAKTLAFHVSRLRDALEPGRLHGRPGSLLVTEPAGYTLRVDPDAIDAVSFERLAAEGRALLGTDAGAARDRLADALGLWRGEPYADVADESFAQPEIQRLDEIRLGSAEDRFEADLALGRHVEVVEELGAFVGANPLRERARAQLMVALYRAGRQAEALRTYGDGRRLLADELGIDPGPELQQLEGWILRQDPRLDPPSRRRRVRNPYKGLRAFEERDSADFFGREALVARLVQRLESVARAGRFLAVVGPSGSGKSSAVRAGLIPALRAGAVPGSDGWRIAVMLPGARPFGELAAALRAIVPDAPPDLAERLDRDGDLAGVLAGIEAVDGRVLLLIDQFEELFSLVENEAERSRFVAALGGALAAPDGRLLVVVTLRADFFARPLVSPGLGELFRSGTEVVTPLARDELERAIVRPAEAVGVLLEPGLATEVIADVGSQPGGLPLLQYALTELFERSDGSRLTRAGYAAVGGVPGAVAGRAEETYGALDEAGREIARQAFLRLVAPGDSGEPTARRVLRSQLPGLSDDGRRVDEAIDAFGRGRLLSFDRDAVTGEPTVEVAHEAILTRWPRLARWVEEAREDLWTRRRLADAAADWIRAGRDPGFLLSGSRLDMFASWASSTDLRLDAPERELLDASLAERRRVDDAAAARAARERALERRATTRLRALAAVLAAAALVASSLTAVVYGQGEAAREQGVIATARELAAASIGNLGTDPRLSLLLAWQAAAATADRGYVVEEAMNALQWAVQTAHVAYPASDGPVAVRDGPGGPRGVLLLAPDVLMRAAAANAGRSLSARECLTYLHRGTCPSPPSQPGTGRPLDVYTAAGILPVERLATGSLAGSRVNAASELPVDLALPVDRPGGGTEIALIATSRSEAGIEARVASGDLPDLAIVARPALIAEWARAGLLVDLSPFVDARKLRATAGDYLAGLGTLGADGSWPADQGRLYGATFAVDTESLVWYPKAAFDAAGYGVPRTLDSLTTLTKTMVADGRTPWCVGLASGAASAGGRGGFIEDLLLHTAGPADYERWAMKPGSSVLLSVREAFERFAELVTADGSTLGGRTSAALIPKSIAAWPMFETTPQCWLHQGGSTERLTWPRDESLTLAAFPFPADDPALANLVRGRAYSVVVFHDRPEVRRIVRGLVGQFDPATAASLVEAGIWPLMGGALPPVPDANAASQAQMATDAVRGGTFRVSAADLMPARVAAAVDAGILNYVSVGQLGLTGVLANIDASWGGSP